MSLHRDGYVMFSVSLSPALRNSFRNLPPDPYCDGRFRRFSQYVMSWENSEWNAVCLPHRPHIQPRAYNRYRGGILRTFEPLDEPAVETVMFTVVRELDLPVKTRWQVDVHQWRTVCEAHGTTVSVPEGLHRDGHMFGAIVVAGRSGISGGCTTLLHDDGQVAFEGILGEGRGIAFDDQRLLHYTSHLVSGSPGGTRDIIVCTVSAWEQKRYGECFEAAAQGYEVGELEAYQS